MSYLAQSKPNVLMCRPDFFEVSYKINPWMAGDKFVDQNLATRQWEYLRERVAERANVLLIEAQLGLPDMVFTANAGAVSPSCVVPSHFLPHERRPEEKHFKQWFREQGFRVNELAEDVGFEGAGDCLADTRGDYYWAGYGFRSEIESHAVLQSWFDAEIVSLQLVDPRFYHLDTCLAPLQGGYLMYFPAAFAPSSLAAIHARVPKQYRIEVAEQDACRFSCNAVNLGERVILNAASAQLQQQLAGAGLAVETVDLSEFIKAGGSAKCLVLELPRA